MKYSPSLILHHRKNSDVENLKILPRAVEEDVEGNLQKRCKLTFKLVLNEKVGLTVKEEGYGLCDEPYRGGTEVFLQFLD